MRAEAVTIDRASQAAGPRLAPGVPGRHTRQPALFREQLWRQSCGGAPFVSTANILASRWIDERTAARQERSGASDRYVIGVALRPVRMRLGRGGETVFEGTMPTGMVHVTEPGQIVEAEFFTPCDFIHFHVAAGYLRDRQAAAVAGLLRDGGTGSAGERSLRDLMVRDDLAAQLSRTLTEDLDGGDPLYAESVGQAVLVRVLALRPPASRVGALPK